MDLNNNYETENKAEDANTGDREIDETGDFDTVNTSIDLDNNERVDSKVTRVGAFGILGNKPDLCKSEFLGLLIALSLIMGLTKMLASSRIC